MVAAIPLNRLLTETDGPFTKTGSRPSKPADVAVVIELLGSLHNVLPATIAGTVPEQPAQLAGAPFERPLESWIPLLDQPSLIDRPTTRISTMPLSEKEIADLKKLIKDQVDNYPGKYPPAKPGAEFVSPSKGPPSAPPEAAVTCPTSVGRNARLPSLGAGCRPEPSPRPARPLKQSTLWPRNSHPRSSGSAH